MAMADGYREFGDCSRSLFYWEVLRMSKVFEGYKVTSSYGRRPDPFTGAYAFHQGIDLVKGHKEKIAAFTEGKVVHAGMGIAGTGLGGYGNVVCVVDGKGHLNLYAHLDSVDVRNGETIKRGDIVGRQGESGHSHGSHLHYEVRKKVSPAFGYNADFAEGTFEPTAYLESYYGEKQKTTENVKTSGKTYKIKTGDTLSEIAEKHDISVSELMKLNPTIKDASKVRAGQTIKVGG